MYINITITLFNKLNLKIGNDFSPFLRNLNRGVVQFFLEDSGN